MKFMHFIYSKAKAIIISNTYTSVVHLSQKLQYIIITATYHNIAQNYSDFNLHPYTKSLYKMPSTPHAPFANDNQGIDAIKIEMS